jgi:DNA-binding response OmpR family regulator
MQPHVLIIDDEEDECLLISAYLRRKGYRVDYAHTLTSGIEKLREIRPASVLLDNNLPDGLGWKYAGLIRGLIPDIKITLITAGDAEVPEEITEFKRVTKPMRLEELEFYLRAA